MRIERGACDPGHRNRKQRVDAVALHTRAFERQIDRLLAQFLRLFQPHAVRVAPSRQVVIAVEREYEIPCVHPDPVMKS